MPGRRTKLSNKIKKRQVQSKYTRCELNSWLKSSGNTKKITSNILEKTTIPLKINSLKDTPSFQYELSSRVKIARVVAYQTVEIDLTNYCKTSTPIVPNKPIVLRAFLQANKQTNVTALLRVGTLENNNLKILHQEYSSKIISKNSISHDPDSTFQFYLPSDLIKVGARWCIQLIEKKSTITSKEKHTNPELCSGNDMKLLPISKLDHSLKLVIVPVKYMADKSERLPDLSKKVLDNIKYYLLEMAPFNEIKIEIRKPLIWNREALSDRGWNALMDKIVTLRRADKVRSANEYYYALFSPTPSMATYKAGILGLTYQEWSYGDSTHRLKNRASLSLSYPEVMGETLVHELFHGYGIDHAPCGNPAGPDPHYPNNNADLDVWGCKNIYTPDSLLLMNPNKHKDIMSYCGPHWTSAYSYNCMFREILWTNNVFDKKGPNDYKAEELFPCIHACQQIGLCTQSGGKNRIGTDKMGYMQEECILECMHNPGLAAALNHVKTCPEKKGVLERIIKGVENR